MNLNHAVTETVDVDVDGFAFKVRLYSDAVGDDHAIEEVDGVATERAIRSALEAVGLTEADVIALAVDELCNL